jgi:hypothetical protein
MSQFNWIKFRSRRLNEQAMYHLVTSTGHIDMKDMFKILNLENYEFFDLAISPVSATGPWIEKGSIAG